MARIVGRWAALSYARRQQLGPVTVTFHRLKGVWVRDRLRQGRRVCVLVADRQRHAWLARQRRI